MELDKKIKIEKLLDVHPVKSVQEIDELISEANRTIFSSGHRHVCLMAGRMNEISKEIVDKWDIFFVEKEKQEELNRPKPFKVYQKDKDKGKGQVGGPPSLKITDNLPPPRFDTPPVETIDTQLKIESMDTPQEDTNPDFEVLYTMNIDTNEVNLVVDKESTKKKDVATKPMTRNIGIENIGIGEKQQTEGSNDPPDTGKAKTIDVHTVASTESPAIDITEVNKEKSTMDTTMKSFETQIEKPLEQHKLLLRKTQRNR